MSTFGSLGLGGDLAKLEEELRQRDAIISSQKSDLLRRADELTALTHKNLAAASHAVAQPNRSAPPRHFSESDQSRFPSSSVPGPFHNRSSSSTSSSSASSSSSSPASEPSPRPPHNRGHDISGPTGSNNMHKPANIDNDVEQFLTAVRSISLHPNTKPPTTKGSANTSGAVKRKSHVSNNTANKISADSKDWRAIRQGQEEEGNDATNVGHSSSSHDSGAQQDFYHDDVNGDEGIHGDEASFYGLDLPSQRNEPETNHPSTNHGRPMNSSRSGSHSHRDGNTDNSLNATNNNAAFNEYDIHAEDIPVEGLGAGALIRYQKARIALLQQSLHQVTTKLSEKEKENQNNSQKIKQLKEDLSNAQKRMASAETIAEKHKESALQATRRLTEVEKEVMQYKREIEKAAKARATLEGELKTKDARLNRALAENDRVRNLVQNDKNADKGITEKLRQENLKLDQENKKLHQEKKDILNALKYQFKLIDVLKKQISHLEAARKLGFVEEEFTKALEIRGSGV